MEDIKKLEIKHIASYLPYGLRWRFEGEDITHEVVGLDIISTGVKLISPYYNYGSCEINNGRPLLRPMSDLYKERNGEVRIMKVAKLLGLDSSDVELHPLEDSLLIRDDWYDNMFRWCPINKTFIDSDNEIFLKLEAIEYLFSNHYDVFGLIEQGLAINKNDIEQWKR